MAENEALADWLHNGALQVEFDRMRSEVERLRGLVQALEEQNARLRADLDEAQLRSIEARNPGIDMDEVRALRAGTRPDPVEADSGTLSAGEATT